MQRQAGPRCYDQRAAVMAQSLGEYGIASGGSGVSSGLSDLMSTIENALRNPTPKTWIGVAIFFFVLWFLFIRRR
jgi:hypothetical protein